MWNHPDLAPTAEDLDDAQSFAHRSTAASDLDDPIAAMERSADTAPREQGPGRPPQETDQETHRPPHQSDPEGDGS